MAGGIKEENLSLALRYIVDNFGKNTLLNANKVESILSDLIPKEPTEKNWAVDAINLGIVKILLDENIVDDKGRQDAIKKAQDVFKRQYVAELRMDYILDNLSYALGWSNVKVDNLKEYELKKKSKPSKKLQLKKEEKTYESPINKPTVDNKKAEPKNSNKIKNDEEKNKKKYPNPNPNPNPKPKDQSKFNTQNSNNKKFLLLLLIPIIIVIFLITKLFSGVGDVTVSDFYFNTQYDLQGSTYVFDENETVELNITLDAKNPEKINAGKVSYSVDDGNICNYTKISDYKCSLIGMGEGSTVLHIYYDGKEIDSINVGFGNITGSEDASVDQIHASSNITMNGQNYILPVNEDGQIQVVLNDEELDESKLSYTVDDSNIASVSGSGSICQIYGKNAGGTNIRILYDGKEIKNIYLEVEEEEDVDNSQQSSLDSNSEVDLVVKGYLENYADAVNYGEISYVEPYLTSTGAFHKELSKAIPKRYEKGTQVDVIGYTKNSMKQESGQYRVGMTIEYNVYKEGETKYQKEYMEFIAVQRSGEWLIDRYENWKLLEQYKI